MTVCGNGDISSGSLSQVLARVPRIAFTLFACLLLIAITSATLFPSGVKAQDLKPGIVGLGDLVVTGSSGTLPPPANPPLPPGVNELDEKFIDPNGASLKVFDVRNPGAAPEAQLLNTPPKYQAFARDIGQVFGLALDKANPPNIYAASTSAHGLQIVVPDADGDGRPERIKLGQPGALWMDGQFGEVLGGGPGTVWKINGETGEITKFADILNGGAPNSGPGLGNIAYDAKHKQFFVSDRDSGLIHLLDMTGAELGTYDHGLQGRPANGLEAVPEDPANRLDITSPAFDAEDSSSWGMAAAGRSVWGLAVHGGRLYYSVEEGPQIWSVGINDDGSFGGPRWELDVPADPKAYPVSDIAFTGNGQMLLAQRGGITSRYDYSQYHTPRKTRVLRYALEAPNDPATPSRWTTAPEDYAIGFPGIHRNTSGGIAIGYGYKKSADGSYGFGSCQGTLWSTGDALRDNPVEAAKLSAGGPLNVHGLQGNALSLTQPQNAPPWASYFVDYDSQFEDPQASGHVGDVEIPVICAGKRTDYMDLRIHKHARPKRCTLGNQCPFDMEITNTGTKTYSGPLVIEDIAHSGAQLIGHSPPPPGWDCGEPFPGTGIYECTKANITLKPGEKTSLGLIFQMPPWWDRPVYNNCAELRVPGAGVDQRLYNNRSCDYVPTVEKGHEHYAPDLQLEKFGLFGACDFFGLCEFVVRVTNVGAAPYIGQLHINDFATTAGATLIDWSPKPEWNCAALSPDNYGCSTAAPVTLLPGDFREIIILVQGLPIAPGFTHVRNCAHIDWSGAPGDPNPHNEYACAELANLPPWHPDARATVHIQKDAMPTCTRTGVGNPWICLYAVKIKNSGTAPLNGPIEFTDALGPHPTTLLGIQPAPWACVPGVGLAGPYTCTHPATPGGLLPGNEVSSLIGFQLPAAIAPLPNWEENTATIKWDNDGDGVDEDHQASATALICDVGSGNCAPDVAVLKLPPAGPCLKGDSCEFSVQVQNLGSVNYPGPVIVTDIPDPGVGPPNVLTPGWACVPAGGSYTCTNPAPILPSAFAGFDLEFPVLPGFASPTLENCAEIAPGPNNIFAFNDKDCATAIVPFPDLAPWSPSSCELGTDCTLDVKVDNKGRLPFVGAAGIRGTLSPAVKLKSITGQTPGLTCKITGFGKYECMGQVLNIAPGDAAKLQFIAEIPANFPHKEITHTKTMLWPDHKVKDTNPKNDIHTSIITIEQPEKPTPPPPPPAGNPDLAISKIANQSTCRAGSSCGYTVQVQSVGTAPYSGAIAITDIITPANSQLAGSGPSPWSCRKSHNSVLCTHPSTTLAPGQAKALTLNFTLPRNAQGVANNCATIDLAAASRGGGSLRDVQSALSARGFNTGPADGKMGRKTSNAIRAFEAQNNLPSTGQLNPALLRALFSGNSGTDSNAANNRACASASIIAAPIPQCTGGRFRNSTGKCICPVSAPVWTGNRCIPRPIVCNGGKVRTSRNQCVCPASKPIWTGQQCIARPVVCSGGRVRSSYNQCVCPSNRPVWTGQQCIGRVVPPPPPQCTGGRTSKYVGGRIICVCPANAPTWTGVVCIPKINVCSGGRVFNLQSRSCVCPSNKPIWNGRGCVSKQRCSGGRHYNGHSRKCVCPSSKPFWNGRSCTLISTFPIPPGHGEVKPLPSPNCSGGRLRNSRGQCICPSNKPQWTGRSCIPRIQTHPQQGRPVIQIPGVKIR